MVAIISIDEFRALFKDDAEFAVIDPRLHVDFDGGHLLAASSLPLARLEQLPGDPAAPYVDI